MNRKQERKSRGLWFSIISGITILESVAELMIIT